MHHLDFFLSTELIPKRRLKKWINRSGFRTRKLLILKWIVLGNYLTMGYKSTLLSTLTTIDYESPIDNLLDLEKSGLPLVIGRNTHTHLASMTDPRSIMRRIYKKSKILVWEGIRSQNKFLKM